MDLFLSVFFMGGWGVGTEAPDFKVCFLYLKCDNEVFCQICLHLGRLPRHKYFGQRNGWFVVVVVVFVYVLDL